MSLSMLDNPKNAETILMSPSMLKATYTEVAMEVAMAIAVLLPETLPATETVADADAMVAWLAVLKFPL